jgi:hypothetical protein
MEKKPSIVSPRRSTASPGLLVLLVLHFEMDSGRLVLAGDADDKEKTCLDCGEG